MCDMCSGLTSPLNAVRHPFSLRDILTLSQADAVAKEKILGMPPYPPSTIEATPCIDEQRHHLTAESSTGMKPRSPFERVWIGLVQEMTATVKILGVSMFDSRDNCLHLQTEDDVKQVGSS